MNWKLKSKFEERFSGVCRADGDEGTGTDGGDGGGGGGTEPAVVSTPTHGVGGADPADAGHSFGTKGADYSAQVSSLLDGEKTEPDKSISMADIQALIGFNPTLGKKKEEPKPVLGADGKPIVEPKLGADGKPIVEAKVEPVVAPVATPLDPNVAALVEALKATVPGDKGGGKTDPQTEGPKPFYGTVVPMPEIEPALANMIFDTSKPELQMKALNHLVGSIMNKLANDMGQLMLQQQNAILAAVPQLAGQVHSERSNTEKFYDDYPELNKSALSQTVSALAAAIKKAKPAWNPASVEGRKELGEATHRYIKETLGVDLPRGKTVVPAVAVAKPGGAKKQPFMTPGGTRPPAGSGKVNGESADLRDLVI